MRADVYADYYQRKIFYQLRTAEVVWMEVKSESPIYSDRIKNVFRQVLKLQLTSEDNKQEEVLETKYGKFGFQESLRNNIFTWAGAIKDQAMSFIGLP